MKLRGLEKEHEGSEEMKKTMRKRVVTNVGRKMNSD
jgi:hypothetical protein